MLGNTKGKQLYHYTPNYVLFDLETTGISRNTDEVIEISAVKVRNGRVIDEFSQLVNPGKLIPYAASMVNNITNQMVKNAPHFDQVLRYFVNFIENDTLVGHNICSFDMPFIYRDCERYLGQTISNDYIDTLRLARKVFPDWKHRRLSDCRMNQKIFEHLGKELAGKQLKAQNSTKICPRCHLPMKRRNGRFGEFWGCTGFPNCRYTENV